MKRLIIPTFAVFFMMCFPVSGRESFPGQYELSKGLSCYSELELPQALSHLEKALGLFSPGRDPNYLQHVKTARWLIVLIHIADDDLQAAEKELTSLLTIDPQFELPQGDQPPKVRYVFSQAKEKMKRQNALISRNIDKPSVVSHPKQQPKDTPANASDWKVRMTGSVVMLFGDDAEAASSGPGVSVLFGHRVTTDIFIIAKIGYSYHPTNNEGLALQTAAVHLGAELCLIDYPLALDAGMSIGTLGMGTNDRYDHWAFDMAGSLTIAWPTKSTWALVIRLNPSVIIATSSKASFYLPVSAGAEVRW